MHRDLAGIRGVGLLMRLRFVRPHRFELRRKGLRRRILRLLCNSIGDSLTVRAVAGQAWRHCPIRSART